MNALPSPIMIFEPLTGGVDTTGFVFCGVDKTA
jgi:hypothetical protein